jgi:hypothetical protein
VVEQVLTLFREQYYDLNVSHFHEKLAEQHRIDLSYTWVKRALQGAAWQPRSASGVCTVSGGNGARWLACCISMAAGISRFRIIAGMT